ncbi:uncharacterized protein TNCV_3716711 [Trichonephila clavipes]|nr:uncharacterized protein TNCV_3716711 [Trichonephila clavipes]
MASAVLVDPTRALQGTNWGSGPAKEESENEVGRLEQLLLYADEHYLAGKLSLGDHFGKVLHGVEKYHQRNVGPLRVPPRPYTAIIYPQNKPGFITKHNLFFHIDLAWHHCRRSCRCFGVKGSARKGRLDLRFPSARCLEIVYGTIATPTSARIVERVTVGSTSACRTILRSSLLVVFWSLFPGFPRVGTFSCPLLPTISNGTLRMIHLASNTALRPACSFHPDDQASLNSVNCEKCFLARLPGMFRLPKSSYTRRVIVTFMNLRICAGLYSTLFLIVAPPRRV